MAVHGIQPDPLVISANDCVSWVWPADESFSVQEILQPDGDVGETVVHNSEDAYKRYDASNKIESVIIGLCTHCRPMMFRISYHRPAMRAESFII